MGDPSPPATAPFMGLALETGPGVLTPRAETELLARAALARITGLPAPLVLDIGCGAGNLALALAARHPGARILAADIAPAAIAVARRNAARLGLADRVSLHQGDMFGALAGQQIEGQGIEGRVDLVVCNPPYISSGRLAGDRRHLLDTEPREAFDGGPYGIALQQRLVAEALPVLRPGGWLAFEFGEGQGGQSARLIQRQGGYDPPELIQDDQGRPRVALARKAAA